MNIMNTECPICCENYTKSRKVVKCPNPSLNMKLAKNVYRHT